MQAADLDATTISAPRHRPKGYTALHLLAARPDPFGNRPRLAESLLQKRADPMRLTDREGTALHTAAGSVNKGVVDVLLAYMDEAGINHLNKDGKTAWDCAAKSNRGLAQTIHDAKGRGSTEKTGTSSRDEPNSRRRFMPSASRRERAAKFRGDGSRG